MHCHTPVEDEIYVTQIFSVSLCQRAMKIRKEYKLDGQRQEAASFEIEGEMQSRQALDGCVVGKINLLLAR